MADEETPLIWDQQVKIDLRELRQEEGFPQNSNHTQNAPSPTSRFVSNVKSKVSTSANNLGSTAISGWDSFISSLGGSCSAMQSAWGTMFSYDTMQLGYLAAVVLTSLYSVFIHTCAYLPTFVSLSPLGISVFNLLNFVLPAVFVPSDKNNQQWFAISLVLRLFRLVFADFLIFWLSTICGIVDLFGPTEYLFQASLPNEWALHICKACVIIDINTYIPMLWEGGYLGTMDYVWAVFVLATYCYSIKMMWNSTPFCVTMGLGIILILCRSA